MFRAIIAAVCAVSLLACSSEAKLDKRKNRSPNQAIPSIGCNVRAGKINHVEFIARCPANCLETKQPVYGSRIFASISSICNAAIHGGIITNAGGSVIVRKVAWQDSYHGSLSNGVRSLSLPRWRGSFVVAGNRKKSALYPHILNYTTERATSVKTGAPQFTKRFHLDDLSTSTSSPQLHRVEMEQLDDHISLIPDVSHAGIKAVGNWKPETNPLDSGFVVRQQNSHPGAPTQVLSGDPNCMVDIAFLMDGSWSVGRRRFKIQKDFLAKVAQVINIGVAGPLMGVIQYGDDPVAEFSLKAYSNSNDVAAAIEKITQKGGLSNVGKALSYVNSQYFTNANGNRGGAPNVAVVLVDGWPTDKVEEASRRARESGVNIFFITVEGPDEQEQENVLEGNFADKAVCRTNGFFSLPVSSWFELRSSAWPLTRRLCDTERLACSKTCLNAHDIAFVIDGSSSVGTGNFRTVLHFVANLTGRFDISETETRVGAVQYTYEQQLEFDFETHGGKAQVLAAIEGIRYWSGGTSTGAAIAFAADKLFGKSKPSKRKIMIVVTDGRSYDDVRAPALAVHRADLYPKNHLPLHHAVAGKLTIFYFNK